MGDLDNVVSEKKEKIDKFLAGYAKCWFLEVTRQQPVDKDYPPGEWQFNIEGEFASGCVDTSELLYNTHTESELRGDEVWRREYGDPKKALLRLYPHLEVKSRALHFKEKIAR